MAPSQPKSSTVPPGWKLVKVNGTRRAINPAGDTVSYYQYLNAQARQSGFASHDEYRKQAKQIKLFRTTPEAKKALRLGSPQLKFLKQRILAKGAVNDPAPGAPLAQWLEDLGLRPRGATWPVGDTPKAQEA